MWEWLRRKLKGAAEPLGGAPATKRLKTYSAMSGYVYQYFFEGHRRCGRTEKPGREFVFSVSADRTRYHPVSVFLYDHVLATWEQAHGRALTATERYAVAKMSLFQAFDEREQPGEMQRAVTPDAADVARILEQLDLA